MTVLSPTSNVQLATMRVQDALAALQEARTLDEVIDLRDQADALVWLCKRRDASTEAGADAWLIARNAERRIGQMTAEMPTAAPGPKAKGEISPGDGPISKGESLKAISLTKQKASTFEKLAALPDEEWAARSQAGRAEVAAGKPAPNLLAVSSATGHRKDFWGTPSEYIEAARELFGGVITLDPASNERAQELVRAERYFTVEADGLAQSWAARSLWLNPPYSEPKPWVARFCDAWRAGEVGDGLLLVNAAPGDSWYQQALHESVAWVVPDKRIAFVDHSTGRAVQGNDRGQTLFYVGQKLPLFARLFSPLGVVCIKYVPARSRSAKGTK